MCALFFLTLTGLPLEAQTGSLFTQSQLFHEHGTVMLVIDPANGAIVAANRAAREFYGYPDLLERSINDINQLSEPEVAEELRLAAAQQRNYFNFQHATLGNGVREVEVYSYPVGINGDAYLFSIIFDITERVAAEQTIIRLRRSLVAAVVTGVGVVLALLVLMILRMQGRLGVTQLSLARTEFRYRAYVDNAPLGVFVTDRGGKYLEVNDAACRLTEYTADKLLGMRITDLTHPDDQEVAMRHFQRLVGGAAVREELRFHTKTGAVRWWAITAKQLSEDRFLGLAEDITERKQSEHDYATLAAAAATLQGYSLESIEQTPILRTACEFSGATSASYTGTWPNSESGAGAGKAEGRQAENVVRVPVANEQHVFGELLLHFPAGCQIRNRALVDTFAGMLAITLARIETEIHNAQLVHEKERLLKEVQHRVKNNMSAMTGLLELQAYSLADEAAIDAIKEAQSRFESLGVLYEQLFRGAALDRASVNEYLSELVHRVVEVFPPVPGLQVVVNTVPKQPPGEQPSSNQPDSERQQRPGLAAGESLCTLDAKSLSTIGLIVNELITNAMKYAFRPVSGFAGRPVGELSGNWNLQVDARCTSDRIEISVADNGPGIPDSYNPQTHSGFGLGMVRDLVSQLNGELRIEHNTESQHGTGCRIVFSFPR